MRGLIRRHSVKKNWLIKSGLILLTVLILLAVCVPLLSVWSHTGQNADLQNAESSLEHIFGTDKFGRDIFVRVWYGTRISLTVGIGAAIICGAFGIVYGCAAGYGDGKTDIILMRAADILDAIPSLLYVILITLALGANTGSVLMGICICGWTDLARIVRTEVKRIKTRKFVTAARLYGAGRNRLLFKYILPNAAGPIIVNLTFLVPKAIFTEAFLSFVGAGISAPEASLGVLIQEARSQMQLYPSQMIYPILILCLLILALNCIGTGLTEEIQKAEEG